MAEIRRVAVLGAGHGGCAAAADLTLRGFEVRLQARSSARVGALQQGITLRRDGSECAVRPALVTTDVTAAVAGADLVMLVVPAHAHDDYARALAPLLIDSTVVMLNPGHTGGSLHFSASLARLGGPLPVLCETVTLTYICRLEGPATAAIYRETTGLRFAALPAARAEELARWLRPLFPNLKPVANVLETGLMNINAVIHPAGMVMNAGWIEFLRGEFLFYREALTPAVARVIEAVDGERLALAEKLSLDLPAFIDYFEAAGLTSEAARRSRSVYRAMQESAPNRTIKAPASLDHRYMHEDIGYGLVPMSELARLVGAPTPTMDALIALGSVAQGRDYRRDGLTLARMGLQGASVEVLHRRVREGFTTSQR